MAPRRFKKVDKSVNEIDMYKNMRLGDVLCPICRSILVEPVTLPCKHDFCLACFNGTMENTSLSCPLCRIRVGSWLRSARKENSLVNQALWAAVQRRFPNELQKKSAGEGDGTTEEVNVTPSEPPNEYESEQQNRHEAEEAASQAAIRQILEADGRATTSSKSTPGSSKSTPKKSALDKYLIALDKKKHKLAVFKGKKSSTVTSAPQNNNNSGGSSTAVTQPSTSAYTNLHFMKTLQSDRVESNDSDSSDSIKEEMRYFKPIRLMPKSDLRGQNKDCARTPLLKVPCVVARGTHPPVVRSPECSAMAYIVPHPRSAFVSCSPQPATVAPRSPSPEPEPSVSTASDGSRVIKQYYNRRRTRAPASQRGGSLQRSPVLLGFDMAREKSDVDKMSHVVRHMSHRVNGRTATAAAPSTHTNVCDSDRSENILRERLDREFALRLHRELNNSRGRQYETRAAAQVQGTKRQASVGHLVTHKKFRT